MKPISAPIHPKEKELCQQLEQQLRLLYTIRTSVRNAAWDNPGSMKQVLDHWVLIHKQHHKLRDLLKPILYERQIRIKLDGHKKAPWAP